MERALKVKHQNSFIINLLAIAGLSLLAGYIIISFDLNALQDFCIVLTGIIIQAFPFLMLGTLISSLIRIFVSDATIIKLFPKKGFIAILSSVVVGFFLPLCDCAVIPVAARLKKKGVPVHAVISFIMAAPIVNPIVILATFYAFGLSWKIALYRMCVGIIIAILVGIFLGMFYPEDDSEILREDFDPKEEHDICGCGHEHHSDSHECVGEHCKEVHLHDIKCESDTSHNHVCGCEEQRSKNMHESLCGRGQHEIEFHQENGCGCGTYEEHYGQTNIDIKSKIIGALIHTGDEFFQVSKLFIIGASISAAIQTFFPKDILTSLADGVIPSVIIMMVVAFIMSICSTSDAFIARSFSNTVPMQGVFAFVVFGPAIDLKNTIMMSGYFKRKFIVEFITVAFITALVVLCIAGSILF